MLHMSNPSTLLGNKRRSVYYPPNGTGRDSYIMTDNGGTNIKYRCQGVPELGNYMKFGSFNRTYKPASYTRFQKYASDGSGRDNYVVSRHGGQYQEEDEMNLKLIKFRNTMRDGGFARSNGSVSSSSMASRTSQSWRSFSSAKKDQELAKTQSSNNHRLSAPKRVSEKYEERLNQLKAQYISRHNTVNRKRSQIQNQEVDLEF